MTILGIETSCDETSASVVEDGTKLLSLVTATSSDMHQKYGGIIPDRAAREQLRSILPVIQESLATSHQQPATIDAIAVTYGPGLIGSLLVGVETAKALAMAWEKPIVPVNHLIGHIYANWIIPEHSENSVDQKVRPSENLTFRSSDTPIVPNFPAIVLIVSGGHTELILMTRHGKFKLLGSTLDDAAGECFDKCGRLSGLPYPYGPYIEAEASKAQISNLKSQIKLPRPLINAKNFDFSFSGLKTAFRHEYWRLFPNDQSDHNELKVNHSFVPALAAELQEAITDVLVTKVLKAAQKYQPKSIIICGGVAANKRLREKLMQSASSEQLAASIHIPPIKLCTDNAAYIASAAYFNFKLVPWKKIEANPGLTISDA